MLKGIDHVGVVVDRLADAAGLATQLGMTLDHEFDGGTVQVAWFRCGSIMIEFIEFRDPIERAERLGADRARIEHIAIEVDDLANTAVLLRSLGVEMKTAEPKRSSDRLNNSIANWTLPETSDGIMFQFLQRLPPSEDAT